MNGIEKFLRFVHERTPGSINVVEFRGSNGDMARFMLARMGQQISKWRNHDENPGANTDKRYEAHTMHHPFWQDADFSIADVMVSVDSMQGLEPTALLNIAKALGGPEGLAYVFVQMLTTEDEWGRVTGTLQRNGFYSVDGGATEVKGKGTIVWKGFAYVGERSHS